MANYVAHFLRIHSMIHFKNSLVSLCSTRKRGGEFSFIEPRMSSGRMNLLLV